MARRQTDQASSPRPAKVRYFEVEGSDETIQKVLDTVERMRRPIEVLPPPVKRLPDSSSATVVPTLFDEQDAVNADLGESDGEASGETSAARNKRGQGEKRDHNAGISLVGDLDFVPNGKLSLKAFFAEKAPRFHVDQVLVICYYLQHTLELAAFGPGQVLSGFKHVGKPVPRDLSKTIQNLKKKKAWLNFTDINIIRVTTEGDNHVEHELPKSGITGDDGSK